MALKIFWTNRALNSFNKILDYMEGEFGEASTSAFALKVHSFVDNLQDFPELGTIQNNEHQIRGFVIVKHLLFFIGFMMIIFEFLIFLIIGKIPKSDKSGV
ncbi:MAG: type II toxin-antitoxin system RelE/ParE family toxin [Cytophagaceae bacterium]